MGSTLYVLFWAAHLGKRSPSALSGGRIRTEKKRPCLSGEIRMRSLSKPVRFLFGKRLLLGRAEPGREGPAGRIRSPERQALWKLKMEQ